MVTAAPANTRVVYRPGLTATVEVRYARATLSAAIAEADRLTDATQLELETVEIRPRKSDITITALGLLWSPWAVDESGREAPLFRHPSSAQRAADVA